MLILFTTHPFSPPGLTAGVHFPTLCEVRWGPVTFLSQMWAKWCVLFWGRVLRASTQLALLARLLWLRRHMPVQSLCHLGPRVMQRGSHSADHAEHLGWMRNKCVLCEAAGGVGAVCYYCLSDLQYYFILSSVYCASCAASLSSLFQITE